MTCCTYLESWRCKEPVKDKEVQAQLEELRDETKKDWRLEETNRVTKRWFRKPTVETFYTLYFGLGNGVEYQVINFCGENSEWSINTTVPRSYIINFVNAYLAGIDAAKRSKA